METKRQLIESNLLPNRQLQDTSWAHPETLVTQNGIISLHFIWPPSHPFQHQSYKEEPTLLQTYSLLSFKTAPLSPNLQRSSQLQAPKAFPEGYSVCSEWEASVAALALLPGRHSQAQGSRQQLWPEAMPLPGASCCLEGHKPLESVS